MVAMQLKQDHFKGGSDVQGRSMFIKRMSSNKLLHPSVKGISGWDDDINLHQCIR